MTREDECADLLVAARKLARPVTGLDQLLDANSGYRVQALVDQRHREAGRKPIGWKVGLTTPEPMLGIIYGDSVLSDGAVLDLRDACAPKIEGEILLRIGQLPDPECSDATLLASIASIQAAVEVADCRITDWAAPHDHWVADNACCGWIVPASDSFAPDRFDLAKVRMQLTGNGSLIAQGLGGHCMGGALHVYRWFLGAAARQGRAVRNGDVLLTGSIGVPTPMRADTRYHLQMSGGTGMVGEVSLSTSDL